MHRFGERDIGLHIAHEQLGLEEEAYERNCMKEKQLQNKDLKPPPPTTHQQTKHLVVELVSRRR
jgi:hypothetical protein